MSNCGPEHRAGYKLVPQSNSDDTDLSEEELRSLNRDGFQIITKKLLYSSSSSSAGLSLKNIMNAGIDQTDVFISGHQKTQMSNAHDCMSLERKVSFGFSIVLCFVVIILFLLIPCNWSSCSREVISGPTSEIWTKALPNIELLGSITPVYFVNQNHFNFVFLARGCIFADVPVIRTNFTSSLGGDVLCLNGKTGKQIWGKHFNKMPNDLDCSIYSSKSALQKDCIIISYNNFLAVVSSDTGQTRWITPITSKNNKTRPNFPVLLPSIRDDNALDFVIVRDVNKLAVISGTQGLILSSDFKSISSNCSEIKNLQLFRNYDLQFDCLTMNETHINFTISLDQEANTNISSKILQHQPFEASNQLFVRNLTILVTNEGTVCPRTCRSVVQISNHQRKIVWTREFNFAYSMTPQSFDLTITTGFYGFVFKVWEHEHENIELKKPKMLQNSKKLTVNLIYERTVMILFNTSESESPQMLNMSSYPIVQLYDTQKSVQPDPASQKHSLFISNLWNNSSYQLVSFYSTFEDEKKNNYSITDYILKSYVRTFDLEKEICKSLNFSLV